MELIYNFINLILKYNYEFNINIPPKLLNI